MIGAFSRTKRGKFQHNGSDNGHNKKENTQEGVEICSNEGKSEKIQLGVGKHLQQVQKYGDIVEQ